MVAVIHQGKSIRNAFHYNENKVKQGAAELIHSSGFAKDTQDLLERDRIGELQRLIALNQQTKVNSVHISLNFDPSERLTKEKLSAVADAYMKQIGFGDQPYLVYEHRDAGHPHIHLLTTNIQRDGRRIPLHLIGKHKSEVARRQIEQAFGLVKAEGNQRLQRFELTAVSAQKVQYGKSATKRAITTVLDAVLPTYKYSSLPELNAVLRQYNVVADRGGEQSRIYQKGGLVYRVLNEHGEKVGVPIKASNIYSKPTLKFLTGRFLKNEQAKQSQKPALKNKIDLAILRHQPAGLTAFTEALKREGVTLVPRTNDQGRVYGLTYIDQIKKTVFNGSALGKAYSAQGMLGRLAVPTQPEGPRQQISPHQLPAGAKAERAPSQSLPTAKSIEVPTPTAGPDQLLKPLLSGGPSSAGMGNESVLKKKRKKRRLRQ